MTLRVRLVLALLTLLTIGLAIFGVATYSFYSHSQYKRLDDQVRASMPLVSQELDHQAGRGGPAQGPQGRDGGRGGEGGPHGQGGPPPLVVAPGTYGELRDSSGAVITNLQLSTTATPPTLPAKLTANGHQRLFDAGDYRVLVAPGPGFGEQDQTVVVAVPLTDITTSLHRLLYVEITGGVALLLVLSLGSWLILRRGLHPLEEMASTARSITAGDHVDLSQRVPAEGPTEVGQLGLALNTMLDDIEDAFNEREATEQRLRQFLADASHELRTPLTSIQGFAELFRVSGEDAQVDLPTILRRIEQESGRMKGLVEDLLLLARLDQARPPEKQPVDLAVIAADACSDAVAVAPDRSITLDAPEPLVVEGDEAHIRQAVANLVTNALAHTPEGSPIEVSTRRVDGTATISVRDHGPGLDGDAQAHVFDRFWQADRSRTGTGAGLGLAIVAAIATEHGGTAEAHNANGEGAEFTLALPVPERTSPSRA
ncbi:MAG: HAMP domain-containing histidine kinase [Acidimicrobiia bacterium]|nr:HAMP domain-containing histidine kinase [Acidimicrobiia bacterium]